MKVEVPRVVGVPLILPPELNVSPAGNEPADRLYVYGAKPPLTETDALYAESFVADVSDVVVIDNAPSTVTVMSFVAVMPLPVAVMRTVYVPSGVLDVVPTCTVAVTPVTDGVTEDGITVTVAPVGVDGVKTVVSAAEAAVPVIVISADRLLPLVTFILEAVMARFCTV